MLIKGNTDGLTLEQPIIQDDFLINIKSDYDVFYTTDGTEPNINSQRYFKPFAADGIVRAKAYDGQLWSNTSTLVPKHIAEWRIADKYLLEKVFGEESIKTEGLFHRKQRTGEDFMFYLGIILPIYNKTLTPNEILFEDSGVKFVYTYLQNKAVLRYKGASIINLSISSGDFLYLRIILDTKGKLHYSYAEIPENGTFTVNVQSKDITQPEIISEELSIFNIKNKYVVEECAIFKYTDEDLTQLLDYQATNIKPQIKIHTSNLEYKIIGAPYLYFNNEIRDIDNSISFIANMDNPATSNYYGKELTTEYKNEPWIYYEYSDEVPQIDTSKYRDWQLAIQPSTQEYGGCVFVDCGDCKIYCDNTNEIRIRTINGEVIIPIDLKEQADYIMFVVNSKGECYVLGYDEDDNYIIKIYHVAVGNNIKIKGNSYFFFSDSLFLQNYNLLESLMYNYV